MIQKSGTSAQENMRVFLVLLSRKRKWSTSHQDIHDFNHRYAAQVCCCPDTPWQKYIFVSLHQEYGLVIRHDETSIRLHWKGEKMRHRLIGREYTKCI